MIVPGLNSFLSFIRFIRILLDYIYIPIIIILFIPYAWKQIQKKYPLFIGKMMFKLPLYKKFYYYEIQYLFAKLMSLYMNHIPQMLIKLQPLMDKHSITKGLTVSQQQAIFSSFIYSIILPDSKHTH